MKSIKFSSLLLAAAVTASSLGSSVVGSGLAADENEIVTLLESGFESGADGWTGRGSASAAVTKDYANSGNSSIYVTDRAAEWNGVTKSLGSSFSAGNTYSFEAHVMYREGAASENFKLTLQYSDASGVTSYDQIALESASKGEWITLANSSYTIPSGASDLQVYIEAPDSLVNFYADDIVIKGSASSKPSTPATPSTKPTVKNIRGDLNEDGVINVFDVVLMRQAIQIGSQEKSLLKQADINGDGEITAEDINYVADFSGGAIEEFPELPKPAIPEPQDYPKSYDFPSVGSLQSKSDIPDPFIFMDGSKVESQEDWYRRASELRCMYEYYMYGMYRDGSDEEVSYKISGDTMTITVKRLSTGKSASFPAKITRPNKVRHEGGAPVIVGMHTGISENTAKGLGYAVITIDAGIFSNPVASDNTAHQGAFYTLYPYGNNWDEQTGALLGWSWGCSKILDALYAGAGEELNINPDSSIVTGVSRWGKATAVCGAFDTRFKMVAPSCSGAGGLALYRYMSEGKTYDFSSKGASSSYRYGQNEPLGSLQSMDERGWFNNRFLEFRNANQIPMDQHMLGSLVADPNRYLFIIGSCVSEDWVNAPSMWASYLGTKHVFDYLDLSDHIAINIHKEGHAVIEEDVKYMVQYFDYHVYGIQPTMDIGQLQTSVFDLPKNKDPFFDTFANKWLY